MIKLIITRFVFVLFFLFNSSPSFKINGGVTRVEQVRVF